MGISKESLEKAYKEALDNYTPDEKDEMTFHEMEQVVSQISDSFMKKALNKALEESKQGKKKPYVKSVENMLRQLDVETEL